MSFLSYSLKYYKDRIRCYEEHTPDKKSIYEAKQLLKMLDDLIDEGYDTLFKEVEKEFQGVTRLRAYLDRSNERPFPITEFPEDRETYETEVSEIGVCLSELVNMAEAEGFVSDNPVIDEIIGFCRWVGYEDDTAYVFLLRDALLPYLYYASDSERELYPWIIGRRFMNLIAPGSYIDDIVRSSFFDALENGCSSYDDFKDFCTKKILSDLKPYPEVTQSLKDLLKGIRKDKIIVMESGCYGTFPMLLCALDERADFKMFTTVPFLTEIYKERIYTNAYEKNRMFETLWSQDKLIELEQYQAGKFYVAKKKSDRILINALSEIRKILHSR